MPALVLVDGKIPNISLDYTNQLTCPIKYIINPIPQLFYTIPRCLFKCAETIRFTDGICLDLPNNTLVTAGLPSHGEFKLKNGRFFKIFNVPTYYTYINNQMPLISDSNTPINPPDINIVATINLTPIGVTTVQPYPGAPVTGLYISVSQYKSYDDCVLERNAIFTQTWLPSNITDAENQNPFEPFNAVLPSTLNITIPSTGFVITDNPPALAGGLVDANGISVSPISLGLNIPFGGSINTTNNIKVAGNLYVPINFNILPINGIPNNDCRFGGPFPVSLYGTKTLSITITSPIPQPITMLSSYIVTF
jgi:hypothetical protein